MCNLYSQKKSLQEVREWFGVQKITSAAGNLPSQLSIFPGYNAPVVYNDGNERVLDMMKWGFVFTQKGRVPKHVNNCRDDKLKLSKFWFSSFENRRCLVPASRFSEYHPSVKNNMGHKANVWFELKNKNLFAFAGIWKKFKGEYRGEYLEFNTFSIVTTIPNEIVKPIHPSRMPVIIDPIDYDTWLNKNITKASELLIQYPSEMMKVAGLGSKSDYDLTLIP